VRLTVSQAPMFGVITSVYATTGFDARGRRDVAVEGWGSYN